MMATYTKVLLHKSRVAIFSIALLSTNLFADTDKEVEIMKKAIVKLISQNEETNTALEALSQRNKYLETRIKDLETKFKDAQEPKNNIETITNLETEKLVTEKTVYKRNEVNIKPSNATGTVLTKLLHIREEPKINSKHLGFLKYGDTVNVDEVVNNALNGTWAKLKDGGYVSIKWLEIKNN